jgi:glutamate--cysteine ligase
MARRAGGLSETIRQVHALFGPGSAETVPPRIGLEAEFLLVRDANREAPVGIGAAMAALAPIPSLIRTGRLTFEPGGQLELSPAAAASPAMALAQLDTLSRQTAIALHRRGIELVATGLDRWRSVDLVGLQTPHDRYRVMQAHFDSIGPEGRRMMRQTASLQVCIDRPAGRSAARQWLAANLIGPTLAAAFRTSPGRDNRTGVWLGVDPSRTGFDSRYLDGANPAAGYLHFALDAEVMPLPRLGEGEHDRLLRTPLVSWIARREARPDPEDVRHHLSTLFPPVRPRGRYLELRFLDAQPSERRATAVALVAILLADPIARETAIEIIGDDPASLAAAWVRSARAGLADPGLRRVARDLAAVAASRVVSIDRRWAGWLPATARTALEGLVAELCAHRPVGIAS